MKKNGFTLAEVLITLGLIGVIAALTLPGLNSNTNRRSVGPALSKAIHNLESANRAIIQEEGVRNLNQASRDYLSLLERKLNGQIATLPVNGSTPRAFIGKDRNAYAVITGLTTATGRTKDTQSGQYWSLVIDVNGTKAPNQGGSDQFLVFVDTKGEVLSAGSSDTSLYLNGGNASYDCHTQPLSFDCTGTIERDGWEATY